MAVDTAAVFIDAHNHLQDDWLKPHLGTVLADLKSVGIAHAVVNGTTEADWDDVTALATAHPWIVPSYGLHPWFLKTRTPHWRNRLEQILRGTPGCAIGEIGLDRWIPDFDLADQQTVFAEQLRLAADLRLPVTVHCLKAWGLLWDAMRAQPVPPRGFLLHAYSGPAEMVEQFARLGAYFSFSGSFLDPRKTERRETFRRIPPERLLVETDAPAMPLPAEQRRWHLPDSPDGKPVNHPANIAVVYEALAQLRGWPLETLATRVAENFRQLFGALT